MAVLEVKDGIATLFNDKGEVIASKPVISITPTYSHKTIDEIEEVI